MKVAFPFRHHAGLVCREARQMLTDAGFEIVCNDTGRKLTREEQKVFIKDAFAVDERRSLFHKYCKRCIGR